MTSKLTGKNVAKKEQIQPQFMFNFNMKGGNGSAKPKTMGESLFSKIFQLKKKCVQMKKQFVGKIMSFKNARREVFASKKPANL